VVPEGVIAGNPDMKNQGLWQWHSCALLATAGLARSVSIFWKEIRPNNQVTHLTSHPPYQCA
jgi:hypothetical protein